MNLTLKYLSASVVTMEGIGDDQGYKWYALNACTLGAYIRQSVRDRASHNIKAFIGDQMSMHTGLQRWGILVWDSMRRLVVIGKYLVAVADE